MSLAHLFHWSPIWQAQMWRHKSRDFMYASPHVRSNTLMDSTLSIPVSGYGNSSIGQWNLDSGFQSLVGSRIPWVVFRNSKISILDPTSTNFPGFRIPQSKPFPTFRNPNSLTRVNMFSVSLGGQCCCIQLHRILRDVTRDDSQRPFLAQHSVSTLLRHCFEWLQYCSSIATLCCAKNRRCKSSSVTSPLIV